MLHKGEIMRKVVLCLAISICIISISYTPFSKPVENDNNGHWSEWSDYWVIYCYPDGIFALIRWCIINSEPIYDYLIDYLSIIGYVKNDMRKV